MAEHLTRAAARQARRGPQARHRGRGADEAAAERRAESVCQWRLLRRPDPLAGLQGSESHAEARGDPELAELIEHRGRKASKRIASVFPSPKRIASVFPSPK